MKRAFPLLAVLLVGVLLLLQPERASEAARDGLALCAGTVIPSLFPFMVVVSMLLQLGLAEALQGFCAPFMGPLFRMRGVCALPLLTGLLGGYPAGAKTAADLYRQGLLTRREAALLLGFCDNCGPAFLLGFTGAGVLGSARAGVWLYLIHTGSALLTGMVLCRIARDRGAPPPAGRSAVKPAGLPQALTAAVSGCAGAMVNICAFVVLFRTLAGLLPAGTPPVLAGFLEMVTGVAGLRPGREGFILASALTAWGGLSVHCQGLSSILPAGLTAKWHWAGKGLQAGVAAALAAAAFPFLQLHM
ncbi:MAG: sporulation protein [Oscillospiraceae bacterium]|nr:sporulation protein [Oscillospiraceae bacterium]